MSVLQNIKFRIRHALNILFGFIFWLYCRTIGSLWLTKVITKFHFTKREEDILAARLTDAKSYEEWTEIAAQLDYLEKRLVWREAPASSIYDFTEVRGRLRTLRRVASGNDGLAMIVAVRSGLIRNLAGISDPRLFSHARLGTKVLIEVRNMMLLHRIQSCA